MDAAPDQNLYAARLAQFLGKDERLARLYCTSIVVQKVARYFAQGLYATREEALIEIAAILHNQYEAAMQALVERPACSFRE